MLPVYRAISFQQVADKGGRTKPWVVLVDGEIGLETYVVKLFGPDLIEEKDSVTNEVLGNMLARQFNLEVPGAALIDLDDHFRQSIRDLALLDQLDRTDDRLKFGSKLLEGYYRFDPSAVTLSEATRMMPVDQLFAFDNLIRNPDRNSGKPNLLVKSSEAFLIDHELGFDITDRSLNELIAWQWPERFYRFHIFFEYLRRSPISLKAEYFQEFGECLRLLDVQTLNPYFDQLRDCGYPDRNRGTFVAYFSGMRQNWTRFVNMLKAHIG